MVDGLSRLGAFFKLVVPISLSGILTVVIFTFTLVTQEFVYALTFISTERSQMLSVGVPTFLVRGDVYYWGSLMAACLIASVPIGDRCSDRLDSHAVIAGCPRRDAPRRIRCWWGRTKIGCAGLLATCARPMILRHSGRFPHVAIAPGQYQQAY